MTPGYVQVMTTYNTEMNRRLYAATARLDDAARRQDRGAFWGSVQGTLQHLLWADQMWMGRFADWEKPAVDLKQSAETTDFEALSVARVAMDARLEDWAAGVTQGWLDGDLTWWSGAAKRELSRPVNVLVVHFFNHQTHHRGQVHAMLTAAGEKTGDTDLMLIVR